jgi:hypothetical protein
MIDKEVTDQPVVVVPDRWQGRRNISYRRSIVGFDESSVQLLDADGRRVAAVRRQAILLYHPSRGPAFRKMGHVEHLLADGRQLTPTRDGKFRIKGTQTLLAALRLQRQAPVRGSLTATSDDSRSQAAI